MKKAAKFIVPIVLILVIILGSVWYLFIYDAEFTRDVLLHSARHFHERGNLKIAQWCYDKAYSQSGDSDAVAIELAHQHADAGNYLQAEKALTSAIADNPSTNLYIALSDIYIKQDKIQDAIDLLDTVCNPESNVSPAIRDELSQLRPAAPESNAIINPDDPELYKSVTFTTSAGTLYVNTENTFPSINNKSHMISGTKKEFALQEGANRIYAVAISDNGLASPLNIFEYELNSNHRRVTEVVFKDPAIESEIRKLLNVSNETVIMTSDLWAITDFTTPDGTKTLDDLFHLIGLESLTINSAPTNEIAILGNTPELRILTITNSALSNEELELIYNLPNLESLTLNTCGLTTLYGIESAKNLTYLDLNNNTVIDITPITELTKLEELYLNYNSLSAFPDLSTLANLSVLEASNNIIASLAGIEHCQYLISLNVANNKLTAIDEVVQITGLNKLNFSNNLVRNLPNFDDTCSLVTIDGSYNLITDLQVLAGLPKLNNVYMDFNPELASINCLADCYNLIQVNVYGTKVKDVQKLTDMSVIVKYDPTN